MNSAGDLKLASSVRVNIIPYCVGVNLIVSAIDFLHMSSFLGRPPLFLIPFIRICLLWWGWFSTVGSAAESGVLRCAKHNLAPPKLPALFVFFFQGVLRVFILSFHLLF